MMWRKRQTRAKLAPNVHHNEQNFSDLVNILTNSSIKSEQKHDNLSNPLDLLHEENVRLGLYEGVYDLSIKSDNLSIKSEEAMREVQRLGQEIQPDVNQSLITEPVAWNLKDVTDAYKLGAKSQQRTWVGLIPEEIDGIIEDSIDKVDALIQTMDKLKDKNT